MTRPQYAPVPRGYVRVWVVTDGHERFGPWVYTNQRTAFYCKQPQDTVTPLDVPAGAIPGLGTAKGKRRKR